MVEIWQDLFFLLLKNICWCPSFIFINTNCKDIVSFDILILKFTEM